MQAEIDVQGLVKKYSNGTEALRGINLKIRKGQFLLAGTSHARFFYIALIIFSITSETSTDFALSSTNKIKV